MTTTLMEPNTGAQYAKTIAARPSYIEKLDSIGFSHGEIELLGRTIPDLGKAVSLYFDRQNLHRTKAGHLESFSIAEGKEELRAGVIAVSLFGYTNRSPDEYIKQGMDIVQVVRGAYNSSSVIMQKPDRVSDQDAIELSKVVKRALWPKE